MTQHDSLAYTRRIEAAGNSQDDRIKLCQLGSCASDWIFSLSCVFASFLRPSSIHSSEVPNWVYLSRHT